MNPTAPNRKQQALSLLLIASLLVNVILSLDAFSHRSRQYPYLSKRLFAENPNNIVLNFTSLRQKLNEYVKTTPVRTGVYFEYLPTGTSIGVNEKEVFFTASLIKLPVVMRTYYLVNEGKINADQTVTLEETEIDKGFGDLWKRGAGTKIAVKDLLKAVLHSSDNTAYRALSDLIDNFNSQTNDKRSLLDVYNYLDIANDETGGNAGITPKNFSSILRSLYLSAYLPYHYSNEILENMTQSNFNHWLSEPIPDEIKIAHKFGLYSAEPHEYAVHSDCGIVYHPKRPYMLCVMVNTFDETTAQKIIREISGMTYDYIRKVQ